MASHGSNQVGTINIEGGGSTRTYTAGTIVPEREELTAGTHPISAGAYWVRVVNSGIEPITVNGEPVSPGGEVMSRSQINEVDRRQDFTPALTVVIPTGGEAWYSENRPST